MSPAPPVLQTREALWPDRLAPAAVALRRAPPAEREPARAALWPLLHAGLYACLRAQAGRIGPVASEDLEDLASQKALELLLRAEEGVWDPSGRPVHEVRGYVAQVARHALVDLARRRGRECRAPEDSEDWTEPIAVEGLEPERPEDQLAAREFAVALRECAEVLAPRARIAWYRRVFLERPSREIAAALGLSAAHVDVVIQRAREALRQCMERKGQRDVCVRPGAFVELWRWFEADAGPGEVEP